MKPAFVFAALYAVSAVGIVAGYSSSADIFDGNNWKYVVAAIPVLSGAAALTGGLFVAVLLAYWLSRDNHDAYNDGVLVLSFFTPFVVTLVFVPGALSKPPAAPQNTEAMLIVLSVAQVAASYAVRDWFWAMGHRK